MYQFLHFGIHENGFSITQKQNASILQLLGGFAPKAPRPPSAGALPPAPQLGAQPTGPLHLPLALSTFSSLTVVTLLLFLSLG